MADQILDSPEPNLEEIERSESQKRLEYFRPFVVKPEQISSLWEAEDPREVACELLQEHLQVLSEDKGRDVQFYNEFEKRYEPESELKWLGDYLINALVFLKGDLKIDDEDKLAEILQMIWRTLDFLNISDKMQGGGVAVHSRFNFLKNRLGQLYQGGQVEREQVSRILDYMNRALFSNLQLYLNCLSNKQARRDKPVQIMIQLPMKAPKFGLEQDCNEIKEDFDEKGAIDVDDSKEGLDGPALDQDLSAAKEMDGEPAEEQKEEEQEFVEEFEEGHPLFGLEKRMRLAKIDDEMKNVIKEKLMAQHTKVLTQLDERQKQLEAKAAPGKKK